MEIQVIIRDIVQRVKEVPGVEAIVLGGSRAKGTHTPKSDIDIGIYYSSSEKFDINCLRKVALELDDLHRRNLVTPIGGWGPWVNGGGWLKVKNTSVDFLYRDLEKVSTVMEECISGQVTLEYQPGHPHGFLNYIYLGEVALCKVLWDPNYKIEKLKSKTVPYPLLLQEAVIAKFLWEARFSLENAKKGIPIFDISYISGCLFRSVSCLTQVLFALNKCYFINEKGAVQLASNFENTPPRFQERILMSFETLSDEAEGLYSSINIIENVTQEVEHMLSSFNDY
ncbi:nucleotidyltransferase domain-containing protein [Bacillus sp. 165]|uniref:nucleotidyltransferase domain-containing protein n=1 Tax=Bacillus sp. 165 TaxID=1529117 RepID=UPI001AD988B3|nr:nucleotidyltransferase domain-containing protein [Bacillus sp. 165]MBO9131494.1 nucleotidyltransferase domain-containing protein [Bacillus sp. 165]